MCVRALIERGFGKEDWRQEGIKDTGNRKAKKGGERGEREGERRENGMGRTARQWVSSKVLAVILTKMKKEATKNSTYSILSVPTVYSYISFH